MSLLWTAACHCGKTGLGKRRSQRPLPTLQSVFLGVLLAPTPPPASSRLIVVGSMRWAGGTTGPGCGLVLLSKPGQRISASSQRSTISPLRRLSPRGLPCAPKGRREPAQRGALRGLNCDRSSYPVLLAVPGPSATRSHCRPAGRGQEAGKAGCARERGEGGKIERARTRPA